MSRADPAAARRRRRGLGVVLVAGVLSVAATIARNDLPLGDPPGPARRLLTYLSTHRAETDDASPFPELRPRAYVHGPSVLFAKVREATATLPHWAIVAIDRDARTLHAVVSSPLFGFEDDVHVTIVPEPFRPLVQVRAASRVGLGDLGTNTRHVLDLYAALRRLGLREAAPEAPAPRP